MTKRTDELWNRRTVTRKDPHSDALKRIISRAAQPTTFSLDNYADGKLTHDEDSVLKKLWLGMVGGQSGDKVDRSKTDGSVADGYFGERGSKGRVWMMVCTHPEEPEGRCMSVTWGKSPKDAPESVKKVSESVAAKMVSTAVNVAKGKEEFKAIKAASEKDPEKKPVPDGKKKTESVLRGMLGTQGRHTVAESSGIFAVTQNWPSLTSKKQLLVGYSTGNGLEDVARLCDYAMSKHPDMDAIKTGDPEWSDVEHELAGPHDQKLAGVLMQKKQPQTQEPVPPRKQLWLDGGTEVLYIIEKEPLLEI